jgi:hypothetical protein
MESKKRAAIVAVVIVVALLAGIAAGVAYQKAQPVNMTVYAYSGHTIHATDYYDMAKDDRLTVGTPGDYERDFNITSYSIVIEH